MFNEIINDSEYFFFLRKMHNAIFDVLRTKTKLLLAETSIGIEFAASRAIVVSRVHGFVSKPHYCTGGRIAGVF